MGEGVTHGRGYAVYGVTLKGGLVCMEEGVIYKGGYSVLGSGGIGRSGCIV